MKALFREISKGSRPAGLVIALYVLVCLRFYSQVPPPWPDEPFNLSVAHNLASRGFLGTDLYGSSIPGMDRAMFFYPPLYFLVLALLCKGFGPSLELLRFFSILCGTAGLACTALILRRLVGRAWVRHTVLLALALNPLFLRGSRVGRMDPLAFALAMAAALLFLRFLGDADDRGALDRRLLLSALFAGLACLTHPFAVFLFPAALLTLLLVRRFRVFLAALSVYTLVPLLVSLPWGFYIAQHAGAFVAQTHAQFARKMVPGAFPFPFLSVPALILVLGASALLVRKNRVRRADRPRLSRGRSGEAARRGDRRIEPPDGRRYAPAEGGCSSRGRWRGAQRPHHRLFVLFSAVLSLTLLSLMREMWYVIYPLAFGFLALAVLLEFCLEPKWGETPRRGQELLEPQAARTLNEVGLEPRRASPAEDPLGQATVRTSHGNGLQPRPAAREALRRGEDGLLSKRLGAVPVVLFLAGCLAANACSLFSVEALSSRSYADFCRELVPEKIPEGSKLYFAAIPEPYFCFDNLEEYRVLGYIAPGVGKDEQKWLEDLEGVDYFFLGFEPGTDFLTRRGIDRPLEEVSRADFGGGYTVRLYKPAAK